VEANAAGDHDQCENDAGIETILIESIQSPEESQTIELNKTPQLDDGVVIEWKMNRKKQPFKQNH
jgi:hypothetical protein